MPETDTRSPPRYTAVPLRCRCGTDKTPIACIGGCGYLCQLLAKTGPTPQLEAA
jgi:hypothetical protein